MLLNVVKIGFKEWCVGCVDGENICVVFIIDGMIDYFIDFNGYKLIILGDIFFLIV